MLTTVNTFANEYDRVLYTALQEPDFVITPRGLPCNEINSGTLCVDPRWLFFRNPHRDFNETIRYFVGETLWYFGGRNDLEFIARYSKFWKKIANPDGTCNSAYGSLLFTDTDAGNGQTTQWRWAYDSLKNDHDTRQAIMHFNRPRHQYKDCKDFVCTCFCNFHIRDNRLILMSRMRSQDIVLGLTYDVPFFGLLLQNMAMLLTTKEKPIVASRLIHQSDSLHLYAKDFELAEKMLSVPSQKVWIELKKPLVDGSGKTTDFYREIMTMTEVEHPDYLEVFRALGGEL